MMKWTVFILGLFLFVGAPMAQASTKAQVKAAGIIVYKSERLMILFDKDGKLLRSYAISLGDNPVGHKQQEGDERTPEGLYYIDARNPDSAFHLSLKISYPNEDDIARARAKGVDPGSMIMIHGLKNGKGWMKAKYQGKDWTDGCIAVTNREIEEIWRLVDDGTPILIKP